MVRAVVDVNVLVSAMLKPDGTPAGILRAWREGAFELVASPALLAELARVADRPALARRLDPIAALELQDALRASAILVEDPPAERVVRRDAKDDYLVALARAAEAHVIVTGDAHLLDLDGLRPPALAPRTFLGWLERIV